MEFIPTQTYVWDDITVDITGKSLTDVIQTLSGSIGPKTVCRITFTGSGDLDLMLRTKSDDVRKAISTSNGAIVTDLNVKTSPPIDLDARAGQGDLVSSIIKSGRNLESMSADEIIELICQSRNLAQYRTLYESMGEDTIRSLVVEAMKGCVARLEVERRGLPEFA